MRQTVSSLIATVVMLSVACKRTNDARSLQQANMAETVATIDDVVITVGDLEDRLKQVPPASRVNFTSLAGKKEFLNGQVHLEALVNECRRRGLDRDRDVVHAQKHEMNRKLLKDQQDPEAFAAALLKKTTVKVDESKLTKVQAGVMSQPPEDLGETVAVVDGLAITVGELQHDLNVQRSAPERFGSLESKKKFLGGLIRFEVLAREAERLGLTTDPDVVRVQKQVMTQKLFKEVSDKLAPKEVGDSACRKYFDDHPKEFGRPEEVRASLIVVKDEAVAKKVLADPRGQGSDNPGYWGLVAEYSIDQTTRENGGSLRYFARDSRDVPKEIVDTAFKLTNVGDNSAPVKTEHGYAVVKLTGRRKPILRSFEEVKEQIRTQLLREQRQTALDAFAKTIQEKAHVKIDESKLEKVRVDGRT